MSPVAADVASACRADGAEPLVVRAGAVAEAVVVWPPALGALLLLEPQPATSSAATKTATRAGIGGDARRGRLNGA